MANIILIKRGSATNINNVELNEGELALAFNADKSDAALQSAIGSKLSSSSTIDGGIF